MRRVVFVFLGLLALPLAPILAVALLSLAILVVLDAVFSPPDPTPHTQE